MTRRWRLIYLGALALALLVGLGLWNPIGRAVANGRREVPQYRVDPSWPKQLPSDATQISPTTGKPKPWVTADVGGTCVDSHDRVWTVNRAFQATATAPNQLVAPETVIAVPSPPVVAYDRKGDVFTAWGNPNVVPGGIHGCFVDYQDNVWIAGNGDGIVQKYSQDGTLLMQIGTRGKCDGLPMATPAATPASDPGANKSHTFLNEPAEYSRWTRRTATSTSPTATATTGSWSSTRTGSGCVTGAGWWRTPSIPTRPRTIEGASPPAMAATRTAWSWQRTGNLYVCDRGSDRILVYETKLEQLRHLGGSSGLPAAADHQRAAGHRCDCRAWRRGAARHRRLGLGPRLLQRPGADLMFEADGGNEIVHVMDRLGGAIL